VGLQTSLVSMVNMMAAPFRRQTGRTLLADQAALVFAPWGVDFFLRVRPWKT